MCTYIDINLIFANMYARQCCPLLESFVPMGPERAHSPLSSLTDPRGWALFYGAALGRCAAVHAIRQSSQRAFGAGIRCDFVFVSPFTFVPFSSFAAACFVCLPPPPIVTLTMHKAMRERSIALTTAEQLHIAEQIASGVEYLSSKV
jgi:hypothetical protein